MDQDLMLELAVETTFRRTGDDPYDQHTEYKAKLIVPLDVDDEPRLAGRVEFTIFRDLLITDDDPQEHDAFDCHSGWALDAYETILKYFEDLADGCIDTVILVDGLELEPEFRGLGIRTEAIRILYEQFHVLHSAVLGVWVPAPDPADPGREEVLALKQALTGLGLPEKGHGWHMLGFPFQPPGTLNTHRHEVGQQAT